MAGLGFDIAGGVGSALGDFETAQAQKIVAGQQAREHMEDRDYDLQERALRLQSERQSLEAKALENPEAQQARDQAELQRLDSLIATLPIDEKQKSLARATLRMVPPEHRATILQSILVPKTSAAGKPVIQTNSKTGASRRVDPESGKILWEIPGKAPAGGGLPRTTLSSTIALRDAAKKAGNKELADIYDAQIKKSTTTPGQMSDAEIDSIVDQVYKGKFPVSALTKGLFRQGGRVEARMAALHPDYNMKEEQLYWDGLQSYVRSQNSTGLISMRAGIDTASKQLGLVEGLYNDFYKDLKALNLPSDYPLANKGYLKIAQELGSPKLLSDATSLERTLKEFPLVLSGAYAPGSPTDSRLDTASQLLAAYLPPDAFKKQAGIIRDTLGMRKSSFRDAGVLSIKDGKVVMDPNKATPDSDLESLWRGAPPSNGMLEAADMPQASGGDEGVWTSIMESATTESQ